MQGSPEACGLDSPIPADKAQDQEKHEEDPGQQARGAWPRGCPPALGPQPLPTDAGKPTTTAPPTSPQKPGLDHEENSRRKRKALQTEMHEPSTQRRVKGRIKCKGTLRRLPVTERTRTRDPHRPEQVRRDVRGSGPRRGSAETDHTLQGLKVPKTWRLP